MNRGPGRAALCNLIRQWQHDAEIQLLFPLLFVHHFWRQRQSLGFAASWLWFGASLLNVARYMKDARALGFPQFPGHIE